MTKARKGPRGRIDDDDNFICWKCQNDENAWLQGRVVLDVEIERRHGVQTMDPE
jgi:hypothetical protein